MAQRCRERAPSTTSQADSRAATNCVFIRSPHSLGGWHRHDKDCKVARQAQEQVTRKKLRIVLALMDRIDPRNLLWLLDRLDVEINYDGFVVAAHKDTFERLILARIDFLVRHEGRHIDKIARIRLSHEF